MPQAISLEAYLCRDRFEGGGLWREEEDSD